MTRLDPRAPLVLDTVELGRRPGAMRKLHRTIAAPGRIGTEVAAVPMGGEVDLDLRLESVMEGVLVSGTGSATWVGECVRCLDETRHDIAVDLQELFAYPGKTPAGEDEDQYELQGELLDLEPVLRDAVVLALPFQPVCQVDCPGLCSQCGEHLAADPDHHHEDIDPRWASLQNAFVDKEES